MTKSTDAQSVKSYFARAYGRSPDRIWAAPGRVNLLGDHTDYNGGLALPFALAQRAYVAVGWREDTAVHLNSAGFEPWAGTLDHIGPGMPASWAQYAAGTAWALGITRGFDAAILSDVPLSAGLSSSAAIGCAMGGALANPETVGERHNVVNACVRAENQVAGAPTGGMDQTASMFAAAGHALLIDFGWDSMMHVPLDLSPRGLATLIINTRVTHALADGQYGRRRAECQEAARQLGVTALAQATPQDAKRLDGILARRTRHVTTETERVRTAVGLLNAGAPEKLGPVLLASHASLRDDYEVSCPELDTAVEAAMEAGALGARMTGGGFGGSALALIQEADRPVITEAIRIAFARHGFTAPEMFTAVPSQSAERISL